jgi:hypothetical protein
MDLSPYLDGLRRDLAASAAPGGPDIVRAAELLGGSIEASARLALLEALSDAAADITTQLNAASVEVRMRGRDAEFVVTEAPPSAPSAPQATPQPDGEGGDITRLTLRMPESLKELVERIAASEGISVNAWLVRAIMWAAQASQAPPRGFPPVPPIPPIPPIPPMPPGGPRGRLGKRVTGFAQA